MEISNAASEHFYIVGGVLIDTSQMTTDIRSKNKIDLNKEYDQNEQVNDEISGVAHTLKDE